MIAISWIISQKPFNQNAAASLCNTCTLAPDIRNYLPCREIFYYSIMILVWIKYFLASQVFFLFFLSAFLSLSFVTLCYLRYCCIRSDRVE